MRDRDVFQVMDLIGEEYLNEGLDSWQNQKIGKERKGKNMVKIPFFKAIPVAAAVAIGIIATGSLTTYAAWKFFSAKQVAEMADDTKLANAFKGKDAILVNESQSYGDYKVTLLGITSGKNISTYVIKRNGELKEDRTHVVIAISKKDGSAMPETDTNPAGVTEKDEFLVSPFIRGANPADINIFTINSSGIVFTEDGIEYQIVSCDNLEVFAKQGVYLGVLMTEFIDETAYYFDKETGEIKPNENFDGMNLLFNLPLDESKGNEAAAKEQLAKWKKDAGMDEMEVEVGGGTSKDGISTYDYATAGDEIIVGIVKDGEGKRKAEKEWNAERVKKEAVIMKETVKKVKPNKDGTIEFSWETGNVGGSGAVNENTIFKDGQFGMSDTVKLSYDEEKKQLYIITFSRNEDGTVTVALYRKK